MAGTQMSRLRKTNWRLAAHRHEFLPTDSPIMPPIDGLMNGLAAIGPCELPAHVACSDAQSLSLFNTTQSPITFSADRFFSSSSLWAARDYWLRRHYAQRHGVPHLLYGHFKRPVTGKP